MYPVKIKKFLMSLSVYEEVKREDLNLLLEELAQIPPSPKINAKEVIAKVLAKCFLRRFQNRQDVVKKLLRLIFEYEADDSRQLEEYKELLSMYISRKMFPLVVYGETSCKSHLLKGLGAKYKSN